MPKIRTCMASPSGKHKIDAAILQKFQDLSEKEIHAKVKRQWGLSDSTWKRFVAARTPIGFETFKDLCGWLDLDSEEIIAPSKNTVRSDAPLYGRTKELSKLQAWLTDPNYPNCRLVILHGLDGIGKNSLVGELVGRLKKNEVSHSFKRIEWQTFSYGESLEDTLIDLLQEKLNLNLSKELKLPQLKKLFFRQLQQDRCLIVLEQVQEDGFGRYEDYRSWLNELIKKQDGEPHSSCILLISSYEKPNGLTVANYSDREQDKIVQLLKLEGVDAETGSKILKDRDSTLITNDNDTAELVKFFGGNPLSLKLITSGIRDRCGSSVRKFLKKPFVTGDIESIIKKQIENLDSPMLTILDILQEYGQMSQAQIEEIYLEKGEDIRIFTAAIDLLERRCLLVVKHEETIDIEEDIFDLAEVTKQVVQLFLSSRNI
jgi:hypothetical protein